MGSFVSLIRLATAAAVAIDAKKFRGEERIAGESRVGRGIVTHMLSRRVAELFILTSSEGSSSYR